MPSSPVTRRETLQATGVALLTGLTGCSASGDVCLGGLTAREASSSDPRRTISVPVTTDDGDEEYREKQPSATYIVDCGLLDFDNRSFHQPVWITVLNDSSDRRRIGYALTTETRRTALIDEEHVFDPRSIILVKIREPDSYRLRITLPGTERRSTVDVPRSLFDCNRSHTRVAVTRGGRVTHSTLQTAQGCSIVP